MGPGTGLAIVAENVASLKVTDVQEGPSARILAHAILPRLGMELELQPAKGKQSATVAKPLLFGIP